MSKKVLLLLSVAVFLCLCAFDSKAQRRKSISAAEVTGTFRLPFGGRFKGNYNEIKILSLGSGKLRISFDLIFPYLLYDGARSAHLGDAEGEATIEGDTAVFAPEEFSGCRIKIKFVKPGSIRVSQEGSDAACGFGHNVTATGNYRKVSGAKPKF